MRLILVWILCLVTILKLPVVNQLEVNFQPLGEVKGREVIEHQSPAAPDDVVPSPLTLVPSPRPPSSSTPQPNLEKTVSTMSQPQCLFIYNGSREIVNQEIVFNLPKINNSQLWLLKIEFELISEESAFGFDDPGLKIWLDEKLVYQLSWQEAGHHQLAFNPFVFSSSPSRLKIWSGDSGDELKHTSIIIKQITFFTLPKTATIETVSINDLEVTVDLAGYLTLEWTSPQTDDQFLGRVIAYEIRYSHQALTTNHWSQAQKLEIVLPQDFSPKKPGDKEFALIQAPQIKSGQIAIRSLNAVGGLSPLGESTSFLLE